MASPDDLVHCPICLEVYDQPRALPCLHTFCNTCLHEYITAAMRATQTATGFDCPVCRRKTDPPGSAHYSEWSNLFPVNHLIVSLLDSRDDLRHRKQSKKHNETEKKVDHSDGSPLVTSLKPDKLAQTKQSVTNIESTNKIQDDSESDFEKGHGNNLETCTEEEKVISQSQDEPQPPTGQPSSSYNILPPPCSQTYQPQPPHGSPPAHIGHPPPHHWPPPPPHHRPPPPHLRPPPPHTGFPPPHHCLPPPHHGHPPPHHCGPPRHRGCHGPPHGGPGGRMHHPHGPRHNHHHPGGRRGCPR